MKNKVLWLSAFSFLAVLIILVLMFSFSLQRKILPSPINGCEFLDNQEKLMIEYIKFFNSTSIVLQENSTIKNDEFFVIINHVMKLAALNEIAGGFSSDSIQFQDIFSGINYNADIIEEGSATITIEGSIYSINYYGEHDNTNITIDFPQTTGSDRITFNCDTSALACSQLLSLINQSYNQNCTTNYNKLADLNKDAKINSTDLSIFNSNFGSQAFCTNKLNNQTNPCFSCSDTDGGINYTLKGTVNQNSLILTTDYCIPSTGKLNEYYCNFTADQVQSITYNCSLEGKICQNGACNVTTSCTPNWNCSVWSSCINHTQNRTCNDLNFCNSLLNKPALNQSCNLPGCIQNWTIMNTSCTSSETYTIWHNDTNKCNNATNMPANQTISCDYDRNGIIGSALNDENVNLNIYINSQLLNLSKVYNSTKTIEFKESTISRIKFDYSFSSPLDLNNIRIVKQPSSSSIGYLLVSGISLNKTLTIDRLENSSTKVCAKNSEIEYINEINEYCTDENEYLINCPGGNSSFSCTITGNKFVVSGLTSSGVIEIQTPIPGCAPLWNCSAWSTCLDNQKARVCTDLHLCNSLFGRPNLTQSCVSPPPSCTSDWRCGDWTPQPCPEAQVQTRTCEDLNECDIATNYPSETQNCTYNKKSGLWIIIVILVVLIAIIAFILVYMLAKRPPQTTSPR